MLIFTSCLKKHDDIYGNVTIKGKVMDVESKDVLINCPVVLTTVIKRKSAYGTQYENTPRDTTYTDNSGNYSLSFSANGQYEVLVEAIPQDSLHVSSSSTIGLNDVVAEAGSHKRNLTCHRVGYVRVNFVNTSPIDTAYYLGARSQIQQIQIFNHFKDTSVVLRALGGRSIKEQIRFDKTKYDPDEFVVDYVEMKVHGWDTVSYTRNY